MTAHNSIVRPKEDEEKIDHLDQSKHRSSAGTLNCLVKHTRPDLSNSVRELSKVLDGATPTQFDTPTKVIKCALNAQKLGSPIGKLLELDEPWMNWIIDLCVTQIAPVTRTIGEVSLDGKSM